MFVCKCSFYRDDALLVKVVLLNNILWLNHVRLQLSCNWQRGIILNIMCKFMNEEIDYILQRGCELREIYILIFLTCKMICQ